MNKPKPAREQLRASLAQLHSQLSAVPHMDAASRRLLREVLTDIERVLGTSGPEGAPAAAGKELQAPVRQGNAIETAPQRLEELAVEFDARHPGLAGTLRQFIILLDRAGL